MTTHELNSMFQVIAQAMTRFMGAEWLQIGEKSVTGWGILAFIVVLLTAARTWNYMMARR